MTGLLSHSAFCKKTVLGELETLHIQHPRFSADILLQGAQIIRFALNGQNNWLWLSEQARYRKGFSVRGGIPVCWPWFGQVNGNPEHIRSHIRSDSAHGFARNQDWSLTQLTESAHGVELILALESSESTLALWPFRYRLEARFRLGKRLELQLTTCNLDSSPFSLSQALHTYLPTQDIRRTQIHGFNDIFYIDTLADWQERRQNAAIRFTGEVDRIYLAGGSQRIRSPGKVCELQASGSHSTVVWNPWRRKARHLSDFSADAWQGMFCVETANALHDSITLVPGASHTLGLCFTETRTHDGTGKHVSGRDQLESQRAKALL